MKEIITIQVGRQANFVGTHFWNLQDELYMPVEDADPVAAQEVAADRLWREGRTVSGKPTTTPRLVVFDVRGTIGVLRDGGGVFHEDGDSVAAPDTWRHHVTTTRRAPPEKNAFQRALEDEEGSAVATGAAGVAAVGGRAEEEEVAEEEELDSADFGLDETVTTWTDFLKPQLHPRSVQAVSELGLDLPFDVFSAGVELWQRESVRDDSMDAIRRFAEECDLLQGVQLLADCAGGMGGFAAQLVEELRDDMPRVPLLTLPCLPPDELPKRQQSDGGADLRADDEIDKRQLNTGLLLAALAEMGKVVPLAPSGWPAPAHLHLQGDSMFQRSALLAATLDSLTLPARLAAPCATAGVGVEAAARALSLADLLQSVTPRPALALSTAALALPLPLAPGATTATALDAWLAAQPALQPHARTDKAAPWLAATSLPQYVFRRAEGGAPLAELAVVRGVADASSALPAPASGLATGSATSASAGSSAAHAVVRFLARGGVRGASLAAASPAPMRVPVCFPRFWRRSVGLAGHVRGEQVPAAGDARGVHSRVVQCPALAHLSTGPAAADLAEFAAGGGPLTGTGHGGDGFAARHPRVWFQFEKEGLVSLDTWREARQLLLTTAEAYEG